MGWLQVNSSGIKLTFAFIILSGVVSASPFSVSASGNSEMVLTTNRLVILDDPGGWDGGNSTASITDRGNQWSGESTTIRWYILLMNSSGRGAQNITVISRFLFPNGTTALTKTSTTDSSGIAAFEQDMDRWLISGGSEGPYTINASATIDSTTLTGSYGFIYDEWGCGSSGSSCHKSSYWPGGFIDSQNASAFAAGSIQNSPYLHAWDNFHNRNSHGFGGGLIGDGECLTCHRGYDGLYRNHSSRITAVPQYSAGIHSGKMPCTGCHSTFNSDTMPILQCYDCHPIRNSNLTVKMFSQTASGGFSYLPLDDPNITAHNTGQNVPCIICHNGMHNVSKPYSADMSNALTEYQQCTACHSAYMRHNDSVSCAVCHSQDAHAIGVFAQNGTYIKGTENTERGNCTNCHQNSSFLSALLSQPTSGPFTGNAPQVPRPVNHSNDPVAGRKWDNYWTNGTDGSAQLTSCNYCHGRTMHKAVALGRPSLWKGDNVVNSTMGTTSWCASCHYQGYTSGTSTYGDMAGAFTGDNLSVPPEITGNITYGADISVPAYFNHSGVPGEDSACRGCHGRLAAGTGITGFMHSVATGITSGGPDCALCHDTDGIAPKRISFTAFKKGVHRNLNNHATNSTSLSQEAVKACWACHGEGLEPEGHPSRYRNPRRCSNNDCHSLSQSFSAPMVYSHFKDAALNSNPTNFTNYNVSTKVPCEPCHSNSLNAEGGSPGASVSHYASRENLIDSRNCIYCHLDRDNAIKWGNATEVNKNRTSLVGMDKFRNKFTAREGEFVDLGMEYRIKVTGVSTQRGSAAIELYKVDDLVDSGLVNIGQYIYKETRTVDGAVFKTPIIVLNITEMFSKDNESFIQFEGWRIKRLHYENRTTSCHLCHFNSSTTKHEYTVIDREDEDIFYTEMLFNSSDRKGYDQKVALEILANRTPDNASVDIRVDERKTLREGEKWTLAENYSLTLEDVANNSDSARFILEISGTNHTEIIRKGEVFDYEPGINYLGYTYTNITIFRAKVSEIMQGTPSIVVLEDTIVLSLEIKKINENASIYGYNASWLRENDTFLTGRIPSDFHAPLLHQGRDGGPNCTMCHNVGELGAHTGINRDASSSVAAANEACWACHGEGKEPAWHPANYKNPRECKSCHVERRQPFYNATYIGDEKHGALENCRSCHIVDTHKLMRFDVLPDIRVLSISKKEVTAEENITIDATAVAGYEMRVRAAEYYVDSPSGTFPMSAKDGSFDEQTEEVTALLDTSGLRPETHVIYVRAMERNNRWSPYATISFELKERGALATDGGEKILNVSIWSLLIALMIMALNYSHNRQNED